MRRPGRSAYIVLGVAVALAASAALDIGQSASPNDRASDLRALVKQVKLDLASCEASARDSFSVYSEVANGRRDELGAAAKIIRDDEPYCTPEADSYLYDLATLEVPGTLRAYDLQPALAELGTWAFPNAAAAINDVGLLLADPADQSARRDIRGRLATMAGIDSSAEGKFGLAARDLRTRVDSLDLRASYGVGGGGL